MNGILNFIATETDGTGYRTSKFELDAENTAAQIDYDAPAEIVIKHSGETRPPKTYALLADQAKKFADAAQILNYFLDGSRRVYKIDDIAYRNGSRNMIYPIVAGQVVAGCCRRADKKLHAEHFVADVVLSLPDVTNAGGHEGFFPALVNKLNARLAEKNFPIRVAKILPYNTNRDPAEKFEDRAVAQIMAHMHNTEKDLVADLVRRGKLDRKNYLIKDGSLEYRLPAGKINPGLVADLPPLSRTPVTIFERTDNFHGGNKFAVWYLRLRDKKYSDSPFDGVVKVEKILVTDAERASGKIDTDEANPTNCGQFILTREEWKQKE